MNSEQYSVNWSLHTLHVKKAFDSLLETNEFVDVTLACEGKKIGAHKIVLAACSTYFHDLFRDNPCQHPIVLLKDVKYQHLVDILKFIYNGSVSVAINTFEAFLRTAEFLQITGLTDDEEYFATINRSAEVTAAENTDVDVERYAPTQDARPVKKIDNTEKPTSSRKSDKPRDAKRKVAEKLADTTPVTHKKYKENTVVHEPAPLKMEVIEVAEEIEPAIGDTLEIRDRVHTDIEPPLDLNDSKLLEETPILREFQDVQDFLVAKPTKTNKSKFHKLEERIGKLEANRSFCKGCFLKTRLGQITSAEIKKVNTFCPGCPGLPNYCKPCFKSNHKGIKNTIR